MQHYSLTSPKSRPHLHCAIDGSTTAAPAPAPAPILRPRGWPSSPAPHHGDRSRSLALAACLIGLVVGPPLLSSGLPLLAPGKCRQGEKGAGERARGFENPYLSILYLITIFKKLLLIVGVLMLTIVTILLQHRIYSPYLPE